MKTNVSPNSLAAYWSMRDSGELPEKERIVYDAIRKYGPMTREQIGRRTGMKEGSACGRVNTLLHVRKLLVSVNSIPNPVTGKDNEVVDLAPHRKAMHMPKNQAPLFEMAAA